MLPLHRPSPQPVVIRRGKAPPAAASRLPPALPPYARPSFRLSPPQAGPALESAKPDFGVCRIEAYGNHDAGTRKACPPAAGGPRAGGSDTPEVKNGAYWAAERNAAHTPPRVPCVSLFSGQIGMGGYQKEDHGVMVDPLCVLKELRQ